MIDDNAEKKRTKAYHKIREDCIHYRGRYIDEAIIMEMLLDDILANYFCTGDKMTDLINMVFNTEFISLGSKENILQSILLKEEFKTFWKGNSMIIQEIAKVRKYRNLLAHSKAVITTQARENYDNDKLPIIGTVNGATKDLGIKMSDLNKKIEEIQKIIKSLIELQRILHPPRI